MNGKKGRIGRAHLLNCRSLNKQMEYAQTVAAIKLTTKRLTAVANRQRNETRRANTNNKYYISRKRNATESGKKSCVVNRQNKKETLPTLTYDQAKARV